MLSFNVVVIFFKNIYKYLCFDNNEKLANKQINRKIPNFFHMKSTTSDIKIC